MPVNSFSVGRDVSLDLIRADGTPFRLNLITGFKCKQETIDIKVKPIGGGTKHVLIPDGWTGSFALERQNSEVDDFFTSLEADYYAGREYKSLNMTETITEKDGAISQYRFTGVMLKYDDAGNWEGDKTVKQSISWMAERRLKVA